MPIHPFKPKHKLTKEQAADIIINCRLPGQDKVFAEKYGVTTSHVRNMRYGNKWSELRFELWEQGRLPERI